MKPAIAHIFVFVLVFALAACTPKPKPTPADDVFTFGQVTRYGAHYQDESIESNVYMLDVYT